MKRKFTIYNFQFSILIVVILIAFATPTKTWAAPSTPNIIINSSCTSTNTDNLATISWASSSPAVSYVDISTSSNFSTWFYKEIPSGTTSTTASSGFHWSGNYLTLQPNTTYYVRLWNGQEPHSNTASFTTPGTCLPSPPTGLSASCSSSGTTASFFWNSSAGATFYALRVNNQADGWNGTCTSASGDFCRDVTTNSSSFTSIPGASYSWWVHACNSYGCGNLTSGVSFTCNVPTPIPAPIIRGSPSLTSNYYPSCTSTDTGNMYSIFWSSTSPAVTYVDISTDNFASWYYKAVSGTFTFASAGFTGMPGTSVQGQTLTFQPNTTYYVRLWNGISHSNTASFTTPGTCINKNNARYISQICPPSPLTTGQVLPVDITMNNNGSTAWTPWGNYNLGSQNPPDNNNWGVSRDKVVGRGVRSSVLPGENYPFSFSITAPATPGNYDFQWKMVQDGVGWFGDPTPNCRISVQAPVITTGSIYADPNPCIIPWGESQCSTIISWNTINPQNVNVRRGNSTFSSGLPSGSKIAHGISFDYFYLYADNTLLDTAIAKGAFAPSPTPSPTPTPTPTPTPATSCGSGIARSTGLVSTQDVVGNFNTTGACVKDSKAAFAPYKIPSYEDLKSLYFTRSKAAKISSNNTNVAPITSSDDGKVFNYTASDVNINGLYNYNGTTVIFIEGNINIRKDIQAQTPAAQGLVFVVKGNVNIDKDVAQINAVIIAEGVIDTAYNAGATTPQLIINGSLVALKGENPIRFSRNLANNNQPAEIINNQPKYLVILRDLYADTLQKWSEIQ